MMERQMKRKACFTEYNMMSRQMVNVAQTRSKSINTKKSNKWFAEASAPSSKVLSKRSEMSNADLSCSDSGSDDDDDDDDEEDQQQKQVVQKKGKKYSIKKMFSKTKQ